VVGRAAGKPLWQLWGGRPDPMPVYGSGCYRGLGHDGMIEKAERFVSQGFSAIKMQVAHVFTHDEDVANVRDMRAALGDGIEVMVDVNQGWTAEKAIELGRRLDDFNLCWLEEPVMADDFDGYHRVAEAIRTPVVGGENHFTHHDLKPFFASGKIPILQPDIMRGGYTELKVVAEHAHAAGLTIAPHMFPELSSHLVASIPNPSWLEYMGWYDHLWVEPVLPEGGMMRAPDRPRPRHGLQAGAVLGLSLSRLIVVPVGEGEEIVRDQRVGQRAGRSDAGRKRQLQREDAVIARPEHPRVVQPGVLLTRPEQGRNGPLDQGHQPEHLFAIPVRHAAGWPVVEDDAPETGVFDHEFGIDGGEPVQVFLRPGIEGGVLAEIVKIVEDLTAQAHDQVVETAEQVVDRARRVAHIAGEAAGADADQPALLGESPRRVEEQAGQLLPVVI